MRRASKKAVTRLCAASWLALHGSVVGSPALAASGVVAVQQGSARNVVSIIQARNPFITRSRNRTVTTGHTTVTEIVQIGPDPVPVAIRQNGLVNRVGSYQRGTQPNLDVRQDGLVNIQRARQESMP